MGDWLYLFCSIGPARALGTVQNTGDQATAVAEDNILNLCDGLIVMDAAGHYSINNLTESE
jgi:hypothetical protein